MTSSNANFDGNASEILAKITASAEAFTRNEPGAREKLLLLSQQLTATLETPSEAIQRIGWAEPARFAAIRLAIELNIFGILERAGGAAINVSQLASSTGAESPLIARTMKHLSAMNVVNEPNVDEFTLTHFSKSLTVPKYRDGISYTFDVAGPSFHGIPAYLKKSNYKNPNNIADGPFQYAHNTQNPFFLWLGERPEHSQHFNNYMSGYRQGKHSWMDPGFYPVNERLEGGLSRNDQDSVFLVDVGGGLGHDLEELKAKHAGILGSLVLQDQPDVIAQVLNASPGIELTVHDFFTPQPVKGARAYYLHSVLHDWDDASCVKILQNIVPAMRPGYSKLLINEYVVPDIGATWPITSMDWLMMALGAVKERTEKQWTTLLGQAGLKVVGIWTYEQGTESLIEAEPDRS